MGNIELKNRFLRSATYYALNDMDGFIGRESIDLIRRLAENDVYRTDRCSVLHRYSCGHTSALARYRTRHHISHGAKDCRYLNRY
ncbi:MAG: hypothetical protein GY850_04205 [bacterium]|nr:hypothetical protein [bacterium]